MDPAQKIKEEKKINKVKELIQRIKENKKPRIAEILVEKAYRKLLNVELGDFQYGSCSALGDQLTRETNPEIVISPIFLKLWFKKNTEFNKVGDLLTKEVKITIFIDMKNKLVNTGYGGGSGGRGIYDLLSTLCEKTRPSTFVPIYVRNVLLDVYYFNRFVGNSMYQHQWIHDIKDQGLKGYENVSHIHASMFDKDITIELHPENKIITLLKFNKKAVVG